MFTDYIRRKLVVQLALQRLIELCWSIRDGTGISSRQLVLHLDSEQCSEILPLYFGKWPVYTARRTGRQGMTMALVFKSTELFSQVNAVEAVCIKAMLRMGFPRLSVPRTKPPCEYDVLQICYRIDGDS